MKTVERELLDAVTLWSHDFAPEFECEVVLENGEVCGDPADWSVSCLKCGNQRFECDACLKFIAGADCDDYHCDVCHTHRRSFADLVRVEGIR